MILAVSINNAHITIGLVDADVIRSEQVTSRALTDFEMTMHIRSVLDLYGFAADDIEGSVISSVVPSLTSAAKSAVRKLTGDDPITVGPGVKTGLHIIIDDPAQLGADLVTQAVGALGEYSLPMVIIDMGTAASIGVIDEKARYIGGLLMPGIDVSMDALRQRTSSLPHVPLTDAPKKMICTNTTDCLRSGAFYGFACAIDGIIDGIARELGSMPTVIMTETSPISGLLTHQIITDTDLSLKGLRKIYNKNKYQ